MAKLKLKTVQNGTESGNPNLISQGDYFINNSGQIADNSGNLIDLSGYVVDESGNLVHEGKVYIIGGRNTIIADMNKISYTISYYVDVEWASGILDLPIQFDGVNPCVDVNFKVSAPIEGGENLPTLTPKWLSPFIARLDFNNTIGLDLFSIPYSYQKPIT